MLKKFGHVSGRWGGLTSKKLAASATEGGGHVENVMPRTGRRGAVSNFLKI